MSDKNMEIWDKLAKTDPSHTKPFSRSGGFSGTAIKPIYTIKKLTQMFGPIGKGWGTSAPIFDRVVVQHPDAQEEIMVYCTVEVWYWTEGVLNKGIYGVGGDKVSTLRSSGKLFTDDEAYKKAFTDAIGNAFKFLGCSADIHLGMFEDSKYVAELKAEVSKEAEKKAPKKETVVDDALVVKFLAKGDTDGWAKKLTNEELQNVKDKKLTYDAMVNLSKEAKTRA